MLPSVAVGQLLVEQAHALSVEPPVPRYLRNPYTGYWPGHSRATGLAGTGDSSKRDWEEWVLWHGWCDTVPFDRLRAGIPRMGLAGLGRALPVVASLPCATLPLGTHKGHPYSERADRGAATASGRAFRERERGTTRRYAGRLGAEEGGLRTAPTRDGIATNGGQLGIDGCAEDGRV